MMVLNFIEKVTLNEAKWRKQIHVAGAKSLG